MRTGLFMRTEKSIFHAIPWGADHWLLGDTDTEWDGEPDAPVANRADVEYVLAKVNERPAPADRARARCAASTPGLRPLVAAADTAATTKLSRQHRLFHPAPGLTAIAGGKYTTYRVMARDAVDAAARDLGGAVRRLAHAGRAADRAAATRWRRSPPPTRRWPRRSPAAGATLAAEAVHACTHQGALDLDDVLSRRMRISIEVPDRGRAAAAAVAPLVAPVLGWSDARRPRRWRATCGCEMPRPPPRRRPTMRRRASATGR